MIFMPLKTNDQLIDFNLPGVDGQDHSPEEWQDKKVLVVIFTCNHCPYAKAYQQRIIDIQNEFSDIQIVAINSNDDENYPDDSFEKMKERAKEAGFNFPYLRDESQETAREFGAQVTPDCFVFDQERKLRYRGRIDDNWEEPDKVTKQELRDAITALLEGKNPPVEDAKAIGCSVKWK